MSAATGNTGLVLPGSIMEYSPFNLNSGQASGPMETRMRRQNLCPDFMTVRQIAEKLGISPDKIVAFIRAGLLPAFDVSSPGSRRPRYRVRPADLQTYIDRRTIAPPPAPRPRRRRADANVTQYF